MACSARNLFFVAVVAALSSSLGGEAFLLNGILVRTVNVTGRLFCSPNGNPLIGVPTQPLVGANVSLSCGGNDVLGAGVTGANGVFNFVVRGLNALRFNPSTCMVITRLPVANCTLLPVNGTLQAALTTVNGIGSTVGGLVSTTGGTVSGLGNVVGGLITGVGNGIGGLISGVGNAVGGTGSTVGNVIGGIGSTVGNVIGGVGTVVGNVIGGVSALRNNVLNIVPGLFTLVRCVA